MRLIDADDLRQVLEVFSEKDSLGHTPIQLCDAMPTIEERKTENALRLLLEWAIECGFGYDNIPAEHLDVDPTVRNYAKDKLVDRLMMAVRLEASFGEKIVSLGPVSESRNNNLSSVTFEQSVTITPLVRCKDCKFQFTKDNVWACPFGIPGGPEFFCGYGEKMEVEHERNN